MKAIIFGVETKNCDVKRRSFISEAGLNLARCLQNCINLHNFDGERDQNLLSNRAFLLAIQSAHGFDLSFGFAIGRMSLWTQNASAE